MSKQLSMKLTAPDEEKLDAIKKRYGVTHDSEAIRIAMTKALEVVVKA